PREVASDPGRRRLAVGPSVDSLRGGDVRPQPARAHEPAAGAGGWRSQWSPGRTSHRVSGGHADGQSELGPAGNVRRAPGQARHQYWTARYRTAVFVVGSPANT